MGRRSNLQYSTPARAECFENERVLDGVDRVPWTERAQAALGCAHRCGTSVMPARPRSGKLRKNGHPTPEG